MLNRTTSPGLGLGDRVASSLSYLCRRRGEINKEN